MRNNFIKRIELNSYYWDEASRRLKNSRVFEQSIRREDANQAGTLGEVVVEQWFKWKGINFINCTSRTDFDYRLGSLTLEIKTKDRTVAPKRNFDCSVTLYNHEHQKPDYYLFVSLQRDRLSDDISIRRYKQAYIIGGISQNELSRFGRKWMIGEKDPSNGTICKISCINIKAGDLLSSNEMLAIFKENLGR